MGKDSPIKLHSQVSKSARIEDGITDNKYQFENSSSDKRNECQYIGDLYKGDPDIKTIEGYDKQDWKSYACDSDKEVVFPQKNNRSLVSDDGRQKGTFFAGTSRKDDYQDSFHVPKHSKVATTSKSDSDLKPEHTKHDSSDISAIDVPRLEDTEKPSTNIDTRIFQKKDCPQEITKNMTSWLDKCSWYKESEHVSDNIMNQ